ncbi:MAG: TIGR02147 family protein [Bdellovibrionales bacterium]|nr:TIGR02147 family protein [Bdellovibrionales bacterium]
MQENNNISSYSPPQPLSSPDALASLPRVFDYIDFKEFLKDYYLFKKKVLPAFSFGQFAKKARIPTRNYLKRVMDGERPLSNENLPKFIIALDLNAKESSYFEALVHYSQAKDPLIKKYYFEQLRNASSGVKGSYIDVNSAHYEIFQNWYVIPVYEYFSLPEASQDIKVIARQFKDKISTKEIKDAIDLLVEVEFLCIDPDTGRVKKNVENIRCENDLMNMAVRNYHQKMLEMTSQSVATDGVNDRDLRAISIAVNKEAFVKIKKELEDFMRHLNQKYSMAVAEKNCLVQLNSQLIQLTEVVDQ